MEREVQAVDSGISILAFLFKIFYLKKLQCISASLLMNYILLLYTTMVYKTEHRI
jgi:hypothetical protein